MRKTFFNRLVEATDGLNAKLKPVFGYSVVARYGLHGKVIVHAGSDAKRDADLFLGKQLCWQEEAEGFVAELDCCGFDRRAAAALRIGFAYTDPSDIVLRTAFELFGLRRYGVFPDSVSGFRIFPGFIVRSSGVIRLEEFPVLLRCQSDLSAALAIDKFEGVLDRINFALEVEVRRIVSANDTIAAVWGDFV